MPAESKAQATATAIAEHHPEQLNPENRGLLEMSQKQLHEFASTPRHGLPAYAHARKARKENG